jgi:hypothetical protein
MDGLDSIRVVLSGDTIDFEKLYDATGLCDQADAFVNLSRENKTVEEVILCVDTESDPDDDRYAIWDKIAEGIGNLQALRKIKIDIVDYANDGEDPLAPDWEILVCILRGLRLRRGIQLYMEDDEPLLWNTEALPAFARAIRGHAMITGFSTGNGFHFDCLDILCSALLTLPALTNVSFEQLDDNEGPQEGQSLESMIELLQSPSLREVRFNSVVFTNILSQAVAKALKERSEITALRFWKCSFPDGGSAVIASALETNTTLKFLHLFDGANEVDEVFCEVLAAALQSNSTLQVLVCTGWDDSGSCSWLSSLFLALQVNKGLRKLMIRGIELIDEKLSTAIGLGLAKNTTLETLDLLNIKSGENDTYLWRDALSFLRTNTTALKTLDMDFHKSVTESRVATIRMEVLAALRKNESLETLSMTSQDVRLESLQLHHEDICVDNDEMKDLISVLKKNYGLEALPGLKHGSGDIRSIFELNRAGRRYLVQDGSSISKGVDMLSRVSRDINSVFFHLLEDPSLCNRSAVEMSSSSIGNMDNAGSTSPGNRHSGDKRGQESSPPAKKIRRRLE